MYNPLIFNNVIYVAEERIHNVVLDSFGFVLIVNIITANCIIQAMCFISF